MAERQEEVLLVLLRERGGRNYPMTPNDIGEALQLPRVHRARGQWSGLMGPAQRVIGTLRGLHKRELITFGRRRDERSGTAYGLTMAGVEHAIQLKIKKKLR